MTLRNSMFIFLVMALAPLCSQHASAQPSNGQFPVVASPPAPTYLQQLLISLSTVDSTSVEANAFERSLNRRFALTQQELDALKSAATELRTVFLSIRASVATLNVSGQPLSIEQQQLLATLSARRDSALSTAMQRVLSQLRPASVANFLKQDDILKQHWGRPQ